MSLYICNNKCPSSRIATDTMSAMGSAVYEPSPELYGVSKICLEPARINFGVKKFPWL